MSKTKTDLQCNVCGFELSKEKKNDPTTPDGWKFDVDGVPRHIRSGFCAGYLRAKCGNIRSVALHTLRDAMRHINSAYAEGRCDGIDYNGWSMSMAKSHLQRIGEVIDRLENNDE